jgi:sugar lactone lactonase YvrE
MKKMMMMLVGMVLIFGLSAQADSFKLIDFSTLTSTPGRAGNRQFAHVFDGNASYHAFTVGGGSSVVKYDNQTGTSTLLFSNSSNQGWTNASLNAFYGLSVTDGGNKLIWTDSGTDCVWTADTSTGNVSMIVSTHDIAAYTGVYGASGNPTASLSPFIVAPNGGLTFYEGNSDLLLNVTLDGIISTITDFSDSSFMGNAGSINSGLAYDNHNNIYFADSDTHSLHRMLSDGTFETMLTMSEIAAVAGGFSGGVPASYVNDIIFGADGKIYFAEMRSGSILSFDPDSAAASLSVFYDASADAGITSARTLGWYNDGVTDYLTYHDYLSDVMAVAIPEPMTLVLLSVGSLSLLRKRRVC